MKRRDVFIQILHEVSGKPKGDIESEWNRLLPTISGMDKEISDAEYEELINGLREEKESIAKWGIIGLQQLFLRQAPPKGHA